MSYVNRLSHNAEASTIRNCDKAMLLGDSHVVVDALINNLDATDIIHGHVSVPLVGDESAKDYVDIIALDGQGNQISMGVSLHGRRARHRSGSSRIARA